ncbi:hypothetical protein KOR42_50140 [Thalassoglobus neptunius]|uniref:Uncharacterized protein n=1 Tax=Thalassoglobus neptunius TaxID=1938619 RepID=A0A5C5VQY9_9PLAN|nr:hypothetical protein KOR42_50140 [Thalassoglobus neptunius]
MIITDGAGHIKRRRVGRVIAHKSKQIDRWSCVVIWIGDLNRIDRGGGVSVDVRRRRFDLEHSEGIHDDCSNKIAIERDFLTQRNDLAAGVELHQLESSGDDSDIINRIDFDVERNTGIDRTRRELDRNFRGRLVFDDGQLERLHVPHPTVIRDVYVHGIATEVTVIRHPGDAPQRVNRHSACHGCLIERIRQKVVVRIRDFDIITVGRAARDRDLSDWRNDRRNIRGPRQDSERLHRLQTTSVRRCQYEHDRLVFHQRIRSPGEELAWLVEDHTVRHAVGSSQCPGQR